MISSILWCQEIFIAEKKKKSINQRQSGTVSCRFSETKKYLLKRKKVKNCMEIQSDGNFPMTTSKITNINVIMLLVCV